MIESNSNERFDEAETLTVSPLPAPGLVRNDSLKRGNREVITDFYVGKNVAAEPSDFAYKVFVRLNAKKIRFEKVAFKHCIFDGCYLNNCVFDSCDFTGCRFVGSNFHQSSFSGCEFEYATFERCQIDDDILENEAPRPENLRMRFARSLRMNYQQIGDAKAVNRAISLELEATSTYLYKSWRSRETYYKKKYPGIKAFSQFIKWLEFWILDFIWGNGESVLKLMRTLAFTVIAIAIYDTCAFGNMLNIADYWESLKRAPGAFLGVAAPQTYPLEILSFITATRYVGIALLTALLVKRFGRR
ncbi:pentapeptide repeat-containing protein [Rhodoferax sp.]|uniref:pentapeptide repeat-containing protein n=1 Tax=Rhodoferax sp. TaxID=50421 RepID=UPI00271999F1|nr:pentapeptide repeat-containing protein [Rhodoferax sp.]MDO8318980.1 pentapeptide repeat-containing protein [Rhodoferax sp.]